MAVSHKPTRIDISMVKPKHSKDRLKYSNSGSFSMASAIPLEKVSDTQLMNLSKEFQHPTWIPIEEPVLASILKSIRLVIRAAMTLVDDDHDGVLKHQAVRAAHLTIDIAEEMQGLWQDPSESLGRLLHDLQEKFSDVSVYYAQKAKSASHLKLSGPRRLPSRRFLSDRLSSEVPESTRLELELNSIHRKLKRLILASSPSELSNLPKGDQSLPEFVFQLSQDAGGERVQSPIAPHVAGTVVQEEEGDIVLAPIVALGVAKAVPVLGRQLELDTVQWRHVQMYIDSRSNITDLLDILQEIILTTREQEHVTSKARQWILRIHRNTSMLPSAMFINQAERTENNPRTGGGFGDIYLGHLNGEEVALKVSRFFTTATAHEIAKIKKNFHREAVFWKQLNHQNILPFYGINDTLFPDRLCIVCPWMPFGNIMQYIKDNPTCDRYTLLEDTASGMAYLHLLEMLHGDIKGANILVNQEHHACLCDFGLVAFAESQTSDTTTQTGGIAGSLRWNAPELVHPTDGSKIRRSQSSDVYAFGMTILEVFTEKSPYQHLSADIQVALAIMGGITPPRPTKLEAPVEISDVLWQVITACWSKDPTDRPSAADIRQELIIAAFGLPFSYKNASS